MPSGKGTVMPTRVYTLTTCTFAIDGSVHAKAQISAVTAMIISMSAACNMHQLPLFGRVPLRLEFINRQKPLHNGPSDIMEAAHRNLTGICSAEKRVT